MRQAEKYHYGEAVLKIKSQIGFQISNKGNKEASRPRYIEDIIVNNCFNVPMCIKIIGFTCFSVLQRFLYLRHIGDVTWPKNVNKLDTRTAGGKG